MVGDVAVPCVLSGIFAGGHGGVPICLALRRWGLSAGHGRGAGVFVASFSSLSTWQRSGVLIRRPGSLRDALAERAVLTPVLAGTGRADRLWVVGACVAKAEFRCPRLGEVDGWAAMLPFCFCCFGAELRDLGAQGGHAVVRGGLVERRRRCRGGTAQMMAAAASWIHAFVASASSLASTPASVEEPNVLM